MNKNSFRVAAIAAFAVVLLAAGRSWSAPISAKAVHVEGSVVVISVRDAKMRAVAKGDTFSEGDRIKTSSNGVVEVELDTSDLIRLDKNSDLVIKSLNRNPKGSTFSIFSLMIGRVKSAVSRLADRESRFEYHTKAAICGVSGTPPFIVESTNGETNVDLLGEPGEKGSVYVRGFDPAATMVHVLSGSRTVVNFGSAPTAPFPISSDRRQHLNRTVPFKTVPKIQHAPEAKKENGEPKEEPKEESGGQDKQGSAGEVKEPDANGQVDAPGAGFNDAIDTMTLNNLSRNVSVPKQLSPEDAAGTAAIEQFGTSQQGVIEGQAETSGAAAIPPASASVQVQIKLK
ncbi:MAG: FecR domain-containing protein [Nitrospinae bacterium]|nr:FecR domain-containing protein [Nitrospinota bacterium]